MKLHSMKRVGARGSGSGGGLAGADSVRSSRRLDGRTRAWEVLAEAQQYWRAMERFRLDRQRNKNYCYGRQWEDVMEIDGKVVHEEEYILSQGNLPLKNNLIRRMVQAILGVYRSQNKEPSCLARDRDEQQLAETMSTVLQCNMQVNRMTEVNTRTMEEFLISGLAVQRKWYGWRNERLDCWTDYVQPNNFFIDNNMRDFRGWDVSCVGEIHDVSFAELCSVFARTPGDYARLREIYTAASDRCALATAFDDFGAPLQGYYDFLTPRDESRCRVIEVWRKETKPRYRCHDPNSGEVFKCEVEDFEELVARPNSERLALGASVGMEEEDVPLIRYEWTVDSYWYYYYLTPFGDILDEGETPYAHRGHPYVFKAWPFIDGEIHSFVANVIDQQRYVNRLITLYDWIMRASAKGLLLFPEDCLPQGMTLKDVTDEWARFNGVLLIKQPTRGAALPQQIASNCTQIGISELLQMELKLMEDISGVNGALQGKPGFAGQSAALYNQQTQNATTSLLDLLETFSSFLKEGAAKDVKNIQQFYDSRRTMSIAGRGAEMVEYDPATMRDIEFDLSIDESQSTPAYRLMANEMLMQLFQAQAINVEQLLENGNFPFADRLLQSIRAQREAMAEGGDAPGLDAEAMAAVRAGADQGAVERATAMLGGRERQLTEKR